MNRYFKQPASGFNASQEVSMTHINHVINNQAVVRRHRYIKSRLKDLNEDLKLYLDSLFKRIGLSHDTYVDKSRERERLVAELDYLESNYSYLLE